MGELLGSVGRRVDKGEMNKEAGRSLGSRGDGWGSYQGQPDRDLVKYKGRGRQGDALDQRARETDGKVRELCWRKRTRKPL